LAYYSNRKTIDILGLNDVHIAHSALKSDIDYVMNFKPSTIQLHIGFSETGELYLPIDTDHNMLILEHDMFLTCYLSDPDRPSDPFYPYLFFRVCE